jgi:hypothetical protein
MPVVPCSPAAPVTGVVVFDVSLFKAANPEFTTVAPARLQQNFSYATLLLNNSCGSLMVDAPTRETFLNLLTAHLTALFDGVNGQPPAGVVGRVSGATEGSVSVQLDMGQTNMDAAWYEQTRWGALYWAATAPFRTFRYVAPQCGFGELPLLGPFGPGY